MPSDDADLLAGPFAHVVVDEAQELTDAEWQMVLARCPSRSLTIVGDRAQARHGFTESWQERLERVGPATGSTSASLNVNYRTPAGGHGRGRARHPGRDARTPTCRPRSAAPTSRSSTARRRAAAGPRRTGWRRTPRASRCVIGDPTLRRRRDRVRSLTPRLAKGLEFDLVVLVDPQSFGEGIEGAVDRYVAMTRATQQLVVLTSG